MHISDQEALFNLHQSSCPLVQNFQEPRNLGFDCWANMQTLVAIKDNTLKHSKSNDVTVER